MESILLCLGVKEILLNIIVPLLAAFIGGLMALLGVKTTLKQETKLRLEELKIKYRPFLMLSKEPKEESFIATKINLSTVGNVNFRKVTDDSIKEIDLSNYFMLNEVYLQNTKYSDFCFVGVKINDQEFMFEKDKDRYIPKDTYIIIQTENYLFYAEGGLNNFELIVADLFDNKYYINCSFKTKKEKRTFGNNNELEKSISVVNVVAASKALEK